MKYTFKKVDWFGEDLHTLYGHDNEGFVYGFYTYSDEHEGASGSRENIEQWESDRAEVERGIEALDEIDFMLQYS